MIKKIVVFTATGLLAACSPSHFTPAEKSNGTLDTPADGPATPADPVPPTTPGQPAPEDLIGWASVSARVVSACTACHGNTFSTYDGAKRNHVKIASWIGNNRMPPRRPLGACPKALFAAWVTDGMPQTSAKLVKDLPECSGGMVQRLTDVWLNDQDPQVEF
jgi:hypothetical protein